MKNEMRYSFGRELIWGARLGVVGYFIVDYFVLVTSYIPLLVYFIEI